VIVENKIELFKLYQRKSASSGRTYFQGRLGAARVAVFKDDHAAVDGETIAVWTVYLQPREPDRANDRDHRPTPSSPAKQTTARTKARPASAKRSMPDATKRAIEDVNNRYASALNDDIPHDL
jgi:hypothetical protein